MASVTADIPRLWSKTNTRPPVLMVPVRALLGEACSGSGGVFEVSGTNESNYK